MVNIHALYIFDRRCECIFHEKYRNNIPSNTALQQSVQNLAEPNNGRKVKPQAWQEDAKLIYGMLFSLDKMVTKISPITIKYNSIHN